MTATPVMDTPRLNLRPPTAGDVEPFFALRSNARVNQYTKRVPPTKPEEVQVWLKNILDGMDKGSSYNWCLVDRKTDGVVGSICLWSFSEDRKTAEVGYDLLPDYHGNGLMREAIEMVLQFGFMKIELHTITAFTSQFNAPSRKLLDNFGFLLQQGIKDGDNPDNLIYALSKHSWLCWRAGQRLQYLLDHITPLIKKIGQNEFENNPAPGKWSKKQILGHLIDSAANNHQRFVRGQFEDNPTISYDQEKWNRAGHYDLLPASQVISFWEVYNRQILMLMRQVEPGLFGRVLNTGQRLMSVSEIYEDYVVHLEHHLHQIVDY